MTSFFASISNYFEKCCWCSCCGPRQRDVVQEGASIATPPPLGNNYYQTDSVHSPTTPQLQERSFQRLPDLLPDRIFERTKSQSRNQIPSSDSDLGIYVRGGTPQTPLLRSLSEDLDVDPKIAQLKKNYENLNNLYKLTEEQLVQETTRNKKAADSFKIREKELLAEINALSLKISGLKSEKGVLEREILKPRKHQDEISSLKEENEKIVLERDSRIEKLVKQLELTKPKLAELSSLEEQINGLNNDIAILKRKIQKKEERNILLQMENSEKDTSIAFLEEEIRRHKDDIVGYTKVIDQHSEARKRLQLAARELIQTSDQQDEREGVLNDQETELGTEADYFEKVAEQYRTFRAELLESRKLIEQQEKQIKTYNEKNKLLKEDNKKLKEEITQIIKIVQEQNSPGLERTASSVSTSELEGAAT